jgi:hypothetical protein
MYKAADSPAKAANSIFFQKDLYLVQLIEQPILRIPNFNFPNLRCCKAFLFFCVQRVISTFFDVF